MRPLIALLMTLLAASSTHANEPTHPPGPEIDVVFALDTTSSMQSLLETAKQKIWSIARAIACAQPAPSIRMGIVAYRDRSDAYVVQQTALTGDLDRFYTELMQLQPGGGGDFPESVNEALRTAVTAFDWSDTAALKLIYLVGDAPPHMDYENDVPWQQSCSKAASQGIVVHAVQCGTHNMTAKVWRQIAQASGGDYLPIASHGATRVVDTPFDDQLVRHGRMLDRTVVPYGDDSSRSAGDAMLERGREIEKHASREALADRAAFKASAAGEDSLTGDRELIRDFKKGAVNMESIDREQLPEPLRSMSDDDLEQYLKDQAAYRAGLREEIAWYTQERKKYIDEQTAADASSFDEKVLGSLMRQGQARGLVYDSGRCP